MINTNNVFSYQFRNSYNGRGNPFNPNIRKGNSLTPLLNNSRDAEYIPLSCINVYEGISRSNSYYSNEYFSPSDIHDKLLRESVNTLLHNIREDLTEPVIKNMASIIIQLVAKNLQVILEGRLTDTIESSALLARKLVKSSIDIVIDTIIYTKLEYSLPTLKSGHLSRLSGNYFELCRSVTSGWRWTEVPLRTHSYMVNRGSIYNIENTYFNRNDKVIRPLMETVVHRDYVPYVHLCMLMEETILPSAYEVWVDPEFDVVRSEFKNLRPHYRKKIKKPLVEAGVEIIPTENILGKLFNSISIPTEIDSIKERKKWLSDFSLEVKEHLAVESTFHENLITLQL